MWDIKLLSYLSSTVRFVCIIWTMWDIKLLNWHLNNNIYNKYYLNHVGYKALPLKKTWRDGSLYYLNHVGYKATQQYGFCICRDVLSIIWTMWDIKATKGCQGPGTIAASIIWTMWDIKFLYALRVVWLLPRIIWTMWDIKSTHYLHDITSSSSYYLNHVGYKDIPFIECSLC